LISERKVLLSKGEKGYSLYLQKLATLFITRFFILDPLFITHKNIVASKVPRVNINPLDFLLPI
jgi:hypothetical protein